MREVVVTGCGLVSPFGHGVQAAVAGVQRGESCVRSERMALPSGELEVLAARVPNERSERPAEAFLLSALDEAQRAAGRSVQGAAAFVGTCSGEMQAFQRWFSGAVHDGDPTGRWYEGPADAAARAFGLSTPLVFASACTSSLAALHTGFSAVASGSADCAVVAGTDATCAFAASGFASLKAMSRTPAQPFSRARSGLCFGEGAGALVLEERGAAERRGASVRFVLRGSGLSADAQHVTAPRADGKGLELAIAAALRRAQLDAFDVYVTHGTGTQANDAMELAVGARLGFLGKPWLAHKGLIGHAMGASGLMALILGAEQMRRGFDAPPAYGDLEPGVVLGRGVAGARIGAVAAAAFGGSNACALWELP